MFSAFPVFTRTLNTFVRANNPTYSFIPLLYIQQYYCLSPFMFSAVALMTSSWVCSTTFCTKLRNATLLLLFSQRNALSISHHSVNYVLFSSLGCWSFAATPPHRSSKNSIKIPFFCGAWGCLSYQQHFAKTEKNPANLEKPSLSRSVNSSFHSRLMCFSILSAFFFSFFLFWKNLRG